MPRSASPERCRFPIRYWALGVGRSAFSPVPLRCSAFSSSVSQRRRQNSAVEKIIHLAGSRSGITENRVGVRAINVLVTVARDQEADAGGEDDVVRKQRPVLNPETAIEP